MKAYVKISSNYGFDHNWMLVIETPKKRKTFYLGQDVKFCSRVLGMEPYDIVRAIGTRDISEGTTGNKRLGEFIARELGITKFNDTKNLQSWALCAE